MFKQRSILAIVALAAVAFAGTAFAQPDLATHLLAALGPHADIGMLLATGPLALSGAGIRALKGRKADALAAATALNAITDRDMSDAEQTIMAGYMNNIRSLNGQIENAEILAAEQAGLDVRGGVVIPAGASIQVSENIANDPKRGFKSLGDFAQEVVAAGRDGGAPTDRLRFSAAAPGTVSNEGAGADGGFAIPPAYSQEIFKLSLGEGSLLPLTDNTLVTGNSMVFPKTEQTPWGTNGVRAYWRSRCHRPW